MACCLGATIPGYGHSRNCLREGGYYDEAKGTVVPRSKSEERIKRGPFESFVKPNGGDGIVEVWLGPVNHPESEFVLSVDRAYIPALIAILKANEK